MISEVLIFGVQSVAPSRAVTPRHLMIEKNVILIHMSPVS